MDTLTQFGAEVADPSILQQIEEGCYFDYETSAELQEWIRLSRFTTDIAQLFHIYTWNYKQLVGGMSLSTGGEVNDVIDNHTRESISIISNGYAMNMISSGMNLIKFADSFCSQKEKEGSLQSKSFSKILSAEYDENFNYALANALRNQCQHGQLIVSSRVDESGRTFLGFDLFQLVHPLHFRLSASFKKKATALLQQLSKHEDGPVMLSFPLTVDAINECFLRLFDVFLEKTHCLFEACARQAQDCLDSSPDKLIDLPTGESAVVLMEAQSDGEKNARLLIGKPQEMVKNFEALQKVLTRRCVKPKRECLKLRNRSLRLTAIDSALACRISTLGPGFLIS